MADSSPVTLPPPPSPPPPASADAPGWRFWAAIIALFAVIQTPAWITERWLAAVLERCFGATLAYPGITFETGSVAREYNELVIIPARGLLFYLALAVVAYPLVREVVRQWTAVIVPQWRRRLLLAGSALGLLLAMASPFHHTNILVEMGVGYAEVSEAPFALTQAHEWEYRRLLKPALAYLLQCQGPVLYLVLSLVITLAVIVLSLVLLEEGRPQWPAAPRPVRLPWLWLASLLTSSFLLFDVASIGYVDQLGYLLVLGLLVFRLGPAATLAVVALCLATHEALVALVVPVAVVCLPRRQWAGVAAVVGLYGLCFLTAQGFSLDDFLRAHLYSVQGTPGKLVVRDAAAIMGEFWAGYKWLWLTPLAGLAVMWGAPPRWREWGVALFLLCVPLLVKMVTYDTYRFVAYSFVGMLLLFRLLAHRAATSRAWYWGWTALCLVNLLTPPYGFRVLFDRQPGLTQWLFQLGDVL